MRSRTLLKMFSLFVLLSMLLAACGPAATEAPAKTEAPTEVMTEAPTEAMTEAPTEAAADPMADLVAAAKAEGTLTTIALPHDWCNYGEAIETFKSKYGIEVNELNPDAGSGDEIEAIK